MLFNLDPPKVSLHARIASGLTIRKGEEMRLDAHISGSPYPTVTWFRNDENVQKTVKKKPQFFVKRKKKTKAFHPEPEEEFYPPLPDRLSFDRSKRGETAMMVREAVRDDHGLFTIRVENTHGFATASCVVNVLGRFLCFMLVLFHICESVICD